MQVPSAEFIEAARDRVPKLSEFTYTDQVKELTEALGYVTEDFKQGYTLGLETARVIIATSPAVITKGVNPDDVL